MILYQVQDFCKAITEKRERSVSLVMQIDSLVEMCVQKGYVPRSKAPWLRYALERRITSIVAFVPLLLIGFLISDSATVIAFFIAFCSLRTRTNGFHAKSVRNCLLLSILGELFFLKILPAVWNGITAFISLIVSVILIWFLAPYNHPNMTLSSEEVIACAKSAKGRLNMLLITFIMLHVWKQNQLAQGILLGIIMATSTLKMAYCSKKAI